MVHDLLHFKSILNVFRLNFREVTTPQSSCVLESSTTFDRQKFLHICASRKLFRYPKTLQIRKTSVYERIWIPFWSDKQRKRPQKLTRFSIFTGSEFTCRPLITPGKRVAFTGRTRSRHHLKVKLKATKLGLV